MIATLSPRLLKCMHYLLVLVPLGLLSGPAIGDVIASTMAMMFLVYSSITRQWSWVRQPWVIVLLVLWVHFMVIAPFAVDAHAAFKRGLLWIRYPIFMAAIAFWIGRDARVQQHFLLTSAMAIIFLIFDMLWQFHTGKDLFGIPYEKIDDFIRLTGPYNALRPGLMLIYLGFPAIFFLFDRAQKATRHRCLIQAGIVALLVAFALAIYLSGERMALLYTILGFMLAPLLVKRCRWYWVAGCVASALLVATIVANNPQLLVRQYHYTKYEAVNPDKSPYVLIWQSSLRVGMEHPFTGVGLKNFRYVCTDPKYGDDNPLRCAMHSHNMYMELFAESGAVGLLLFCTAIVLWLKQCWHNRRLIVSDMVLAGLFITFVIRIWPLAAISSQFNPWAAVPLWMFTGLLLARIELLRNEQIKP